MTAYTVSYSYTLFSARPPTDRALFHAHTTHGDRSFGAAGPRVWYSLPVHLRDEDISYNSFRRELKTYWLTLLPECNTTSCVIALYKYPY